MKGNYELIILPHQQKAQQNICIFYGLYRAILLQVEARRNLHDNFLRHENPIIEIIVNDNDIVQFKTDFAEGFMGLD